MPTINSRVRAVAAATASLVSRRRGALILTVLVAVGLTVQTPSPALANGPAKVTELIIVGFNLRECVQVRAGICDAAFATGIVTVDLALMNSNPALSRAQSVSVSDVCASVANAARLCQNGGPGTVTGIVDWGADAAFELTGRTLSATLQLFMDGHALGAEQSTALIGPTF